MVIREIVALGEDLKRGVRNIKEVVIFDEEEITEEMSCKRAFGSRHRPHRHACSSTRRRSRSLFFEKLETMATPRRRLKRHRKTRYGLSNREMVAQFRRIVRELKYTNAGTQAAAR
jgi:RNA polymerase primary sigma factor